jgi:hypothetical protein
VDLDEHKANFQISSLLRNLDLLMEKGNMVVQLGLTGLRCMQKGKTSLMLMYDLQGAKFQSKYMFSAGNRLTAHVA